MTEVDTTIAALLNAAHGLQTELRVTPYGKRERLYIYCDLLYCYREIYHVLGECGIDPYDAVYIRSVVSPKHAPLN
jgi:hypothetical protein